MTDPDRLPPPVALIVLGLVALVAVGSILGVTVALAILWAMGAFR